MTDLRGAPSCADWDPLGTLGSVPPRLLLKRLNGAVAYTDRTTSPVQLISGASSVSPDPDRDDFGNFGKAHSSLLELDGGLCQLLGKAPLLRLIFGNGP